MAARKASPQTENGYTMLANELYDALIHYRIPGEQRQVLDFIIRKTYGFRKKVDAIPLGQFVKATGIQKPHVVRALNSLFAKKIITIAKKGNDGVSTYGFNKDYTQWKALPKKVTLPKKAMTVAKKGNKSLPKKAPSKESTKENTKEKKNTAFKKNAVGVEVFYLTKKKKKLTGWKLKTFEEFWIAFNWKKGKAEAADAWLQIPGLTKDLVTETIIPAALLEADGRQAIIDRGSTPKWAQGWLSGRRWEDEQQKEIDPGKSWVEKMRKQDELRKIQRSNK